MATVTDINLGTDDDDGTGTPGLKGGGAIINANTKSINDEMVAYQGGSGLDVAGQVTADPTAATDRPIAAGDSINTVAWLLQKQVTGAPANLRWVGTWDASTNAPDLTAAANQGETDASGNFTGFVYQVNTDGAQDLGDGSRLYKVGDWVHFGAGGTVIFTDNSEEYGYVFKGALTADPVGAMFPRDRYHLTGSDFDVTLPPLASFADGQMMQLVNVAGTRHSIIADAADGGATLFHSDTTQQLVEIERLSATEWRVGPNLVTTGSLGYVEYTVAAAAPPADWGLTEHVSRGDAVALVGNAIVVKAGRRVKLSFNGSRAEASGTEEFSYAFHDGTDFIGNEGTIMAHGVGATGISGVAVASVEGPASVTIRGTKITPAADVALAANGATNPTAGAMVTVEEYPPDTYQAGTLIATDGDNHFVQEMDTITLDTATFTPGATGRYAFTQDLIATNNQCWYDLGTTAGGNDLYNGFSNRLDANQLSITRIFTLTQGETYHLTGLFGGGTTTGKVRVEIEYLDHAQAIRAEDAAVVLYTGTTGGGANVTVPIPLTVNGKTLVNVDASQEYGSGQYSRGQHDGTNLYISANYAAGTVHFNNRSGVYAAARGYRIFATYI